MEEYDYIDVFSINPNPFTKEVRISFTLEKNSLIQIDVYYNNGLLVERLAEKKYTLGTHQLCWDSKDLPAGVFIIRLTTGNRVYMAKVVKSNR